MTERHTADSITSDALDQLYDRAEQAEAWAAAHVEAESADAAAGSYAHRAEQAEAAIERVRELHRETCLVANGPLRNSFSCGMCTALDQPQQPTTPIHLAKGTNAEDCPACKGTNPDYPFLCPGPEQQPTA